MSIILLSVGTILSVIFIILLFIGQKYDRLLDPLEGDAFPLKTIYTVGLAAQDLKPVRLHGGVGDKLRKAATLYYSKQYSEYYARIAWAQVISFSLLSLSVFFVLAGLAPDMAGFFGLLGIVVCVLAAYYFLTQTKNKVTSRQEACEKEFPNAISKLALIVNSGVILHDAWEMVASGKEGIFYKMMCDSCEEMKNGASDIDAIHKFGVLTNSEDIKKFTSALIQSIERGGGELPRFLATQSSELWAAKRQKSLQKGEKAASALLMPIALMFLGVMLIVISAAMSSFGI